jgi:hypothetical protein
LQGYKAAAGQQQHRINIRRQAAATSQELKTNSLLLLAPIPHKLALATATSVWLLKQLEQAARQQQGVTWIKQLQAMKWQLCS